MSLKNIQTEVDASFLYGILATHEKDPNVADIFAQMSEIERGHALRFMEKNQLELSTLPGPSFQARMLNRIGKIIGYEFVLGVLLDTEKSMSSSIQLARNKTRLSSQVSDESHVAVLKNILYKSDNVSGSVLSRFEKRHRSVGGNALRAAVLGGNDGLVSNFSLVMGIAGATSGQSEILLAGVAGLLAGALSMALGEWISVKSSLELYQNQMQLEMDELLTNPEGEVKEIALIYQSKGIPKDQAQKMAQEMIANTEKAHAFLVKEELGINPEEMSSSAMEAAISSFVLFAIGAIIPVLPFFFTTGFTSILLSTVFSALGLFAIGAAITLFTGKNIWYSGFRQVLFGLMAAGITFGIGKLIGISIAG
jgi:vacuolar iron transporter family protein